MNQNHTPSSPYPTEPQYGLYPPIEDEINLADLAHSVWRTRKAWLLSIVIVSLLFWGSWVAKWLITPPPPTIYSLPVHLTLPGVTTETYPNGTPFSRSDLIASDIIEAVYEKNNIGQYGLALDEFLALIRIAPYGLDLKLIQAKYLQQLDNKKLSPQEIDELRDRQKQEITQASLWGVLLSLTLSDSDLPDDIIATTLLDVPLTWAQKAISERNVLALDMERLTPNVFDKKLLSNMDYLPTLDYLNAKCLIIKTHLESLQKYPHALSAQDTESRMTIPDLLRNLADIKRYKLDRLGGFVREFGYSKRLSVTIQYYQNERTKLSEQLTEWQEKGQLIQRILDGNPTRDKKATASEGNRRTTKTTAISPLIGDATLNKIISLSETASDVAFKQELIRQQHGYDEKAVMARLAIQKVDRNLLALKDQDQDQDQDQDMLSYISSQMNNEVPFIIEQLVSIISISNRIQNQIGSASRGDSDNLYQPPSPRLDVSGGVKLTPSRQEILVFVLLLFLTSIIVIPIMMFRNNYQDKKGDTGDNQS